MGTTLTGTQIQNTYDGLLKTTDNTAITATTKLISDGLGNDTCIKVGTGGTDFLGNVDFSAATVTGLPDNNTTYDLASAQAAANVNLNLTGSDATTDTVTLAAGTNITLTDNGSNQITIDAAGGGGAAGLESGSGADSMQSAASLTTLAANACMPSSIALGNGASVVTTIATPVNVQRDGIAIGNGACAIIDTDYSFTDNIGGIAIGLDACAKNGAATPAVAIGNLAAALDDSAVSVGRVSCAVAGCSIAIGNLASVVAGSSHGIALGSSTCSSAYGAIAIGHGTRATAGGFYQGAAVLGNNSCATAVCAVALGVAVTASRADTVAGNQFESKAVGKGIVVTSPDGLTTLGIGIDNTGAIVTYTP